MLPESAFHSISMSFHSISCHSMLSVYVLLGLLMWVSVCVLESFLMFWWVSRSVWNCVGFGGLGSTVVSKVLHNGVQHCSGLVNKGFPSQCASWLRPSAHFQDGLSNSSCLDLVNKGFPSQCASGRILHTPFKIVWSIWSFIAFTISCLHVHCIHSSISILNYSWAGVAMCYESE